MNTHDSTNMEAGSPEPVITPTTTITTRPPMMKRIRTSAWVQHLLRTLQFISAFTSMVVFSIRLAKIMRLTHRASHSNGAVEGILVAAVAYTVFLLVLKIFYKSSRRSTVLPTYYAWIVVLLDLLFVGAFIAVAYETRPNGGKSGPCAGNTQVGEATVGGRAGCKLPWGTFILAIISTILHAASALFKGVKSRREQKKVLNKETTEDAARIV